MNSAPKHPTERGSKRSIPRVLFAYSGPNKSELLSVMIPMMMRGSLPDCKQETWWTKDVSQQDLANSSGVASRSTFTRRLALFAKTSFWTMLQRSQQSTRVRRMRAAQGWKVKARPRDLRPATPHVHSIVHAKRRFAMPNSYNCRLPIAAFDRSKDRSRVPHIQELLEHEEWSRMFDPRCAGENGGAAAPDSVLENFPNRKGEFRGFDGVKELHRWVWSHELGDMPAWMSDRQKRNWSQASDTERMVLTYYLTFGLVDRGGILNVHQDKVAWSCGISVKSVYRANCKLSVTHELIRVAHPKPEITAGGYRRGPQRILWLPIRRLTPEEAQAEAERFSRRLHALENSVEGARNGAFFRQALDIHSELLRAWIGKEHNLKAFRREVYRRLRKQGIPNRHARDLMSEPHQSLPP